MRKRRLIPLNSLRAFESATRLKSISRAAIELSVTHGAVSRQIKNLEDFLNLRLLERSVNGVLATPKGAKLYEKVREAFDSIEATLEDMDFDVNSNTVRVSLLPSFAARWLMPRLYGFYEQHPDIRIHLITSHSLVDLEQDHFDLAIRYGEGDWEDVNAERLFDVHLTPVASPDFRESLPRKFALQDILKMPLLQDCYSDAWPQWLSEFGVHAENVNGATYDDYNLVIEAAVEGHGVALGRTEIIGPELKSGRLLPLVDESIRSKWAYYLVTPKNVEMRKSVSRFYAWLLAQSRQVEAIEAS